MIAPFSAESAARIPGGFEITSSATLHDGDDDYALTVTEWELTIDEEREPHAKLTMTLAMPEPDILAVIDPRREQYVTLEAGYKWDDETTETDPNYAYMQLRKRIINTEQGTVSIECYSDEDRVADSDMPVAYVSGTSLTFTSATSQIAYFLGGSTLNSTIPSETQLPSEYPMSGVDPAEITDTLQTVRAWADAIGAVIYADQAGTWHLHPAPVLGTSTAILATGAAGTIGRIVDALDRDSGWGTHLVVTYDNASYSPRRWAEYDDTQVGEAKKVIHLERRDPPPNATADAGGKVADPALPGLMKRIRDRAAQLEVTIPAHLWLRVYQTITATPPDADQQRVLVAAVTTRSNGTQTVRTRKPDLS